MLWAADAYLKLCGNKSITVILFSFQIVRYLPNSAAILCGSIDRDCYKERVSKKLHIFKHTLSRRALRMSVTEVL
jgi:hypothetical protein